MQRRKVAQRLLIGALAIALLLFALYLILPDSDQRLPDPAKVKRMTAELYSYDPSRLPKVPEFEVQREDVPIILQSLEPKQLDFMPADWVVHGDLTMETVDGKEIQVHLFWTSEETGAFAVGSLRSRRYYRGGSNSAIDNAVRTAYANAKPASAR
ncbi:MAG TPA: hypothetical protein VGZ47_15725 [Gemmataceae bacterium]|jgi:hypothetical protein|nr:hypothetical protein [Gemmataceae bacterium]